MKIALCCIGRRENRYAIEYVDFYKKMGIDKIFIYDNNYNGEEYFEDVLQPYIGEGLVEITNFRNKSVCQLEAYQDCYDKHGNEYDWMCFFDFDEFILLKENNTLKELISTGIYDGYDVIHINELIYGDSGVLRYEDKPVVERFLIPVQPIDYKKTFDFPENCHVKSIVRGGITVEWKQTPHTPSNKLKGCDSTGQPCNSTSPFVIPYKHEKIILRHYKTKTIEEFATLKVKRGYPDGNKDFFKNNDWIEDFFKENERTDEKLKIIDEIVHKNVPKISVIIPCYNYARYITETIDSLKASTYKGFHCIVVNDGSTDNSEEVILRDIYGDDRFEYVKNKNHGLSYTRNFGIKRTDSKYILCLDSDDKISPTYIENAVKYLDEHPDTAIYYGKANMFYDDGEEKYWDLPSFDYKKLLKNNMIYCSFVYRRKDYERTNGYDETMNGYEDWDFLVRLLYNNDKVYRSDEIVFYYRRHSDSMDAKQKDKFKDFRSLIATKNKDIYLQYFPIKKTENNLDIFICTDRMFEPLVNDDTYKILDRRTVKCSSLAANKEFYGDFLNYIYVSENLDLNEYVGFCKYDKYFLFKDEIPNMKEAFETSNCIAVKNITFKITNAEQYSKFHNIEDLEIVGSILKEKYDEYYKIYNAFINSKVFFPYSMFIMKKEDFKECIDFVKNVLDEYIKVVGTDIEGRIIENKEKYLKGDNTYDHLHYQCKIGEFLAERLINIFMFKNFKHLKIYNLTEK